MDNIRYTSISHQPARFGQSFVAGMEDDNANLTSPIANQRVDEFVLNPANGTLASMQDPISMTSLLTDQNRAYSFIV